MSEPVSWTAPRTGNVGPPASSASSARGAALRHPSPAGPASARALAEAGATILLAGVVHHVEGLQGLGQIQRARWGALGASAARGPADLVVIGRSSGVTDPAAAIAGLKDDPATGSIPVLHVADTEGGCGGDCRADVCLPDPPPAGQVARAARVLIELGHARAQAASRSQARSERLEALGRLTGGIVHDFNNLLFVITGQVELARRQLAPDHPAFARLAPALQAAERAAALTRQLLAFGRGSDPRPRLVDLNDVVAQLGKMLQRLIGEDVELAVRAGRGLGWVEADFAETEQLVLNLALNARDAMPQGGRLVIETKRVEIAGGSAPPVPPGRYAMLTVTDDGVGMDEETRRHIFEPFFTTKPEGAGSGLGLATVHRIVERHGGAIRVDTAPGRGTTFRVYLPCVERLAEPERPAVEPSARQGGRETVLVAEDSEAVREVTRELLEALGYTVVTAGSGEEALEAARAHHGPIDVLLTDVVMPGMRGASLARQMRAVRPGLRVLFMSGYGDGAEPGGAGERDAVLRKPFDQDLLARALREALDQDGSRGA
jgi:signal transduction histidine kinase/ActR/RegA family two-component response regulator